MATIHADQSRAATTGPLRRGLQIVLTAMGLIMVVMGSVTVVLGAASVPREGVVVPDVDTEMRFYAVWYAVAGVALLRAARRVESEGFVVRLVAIAFFVAGCARILSWAVVGRPHALAIILLAIELAVPFVIVPWHAAMARTD